MSWIVSLSAQHEPNRAPPARTNHESRSRSSAVISPVQLDTNTPCGCSPSAMTWPELVRRCSILMPSSTFSMWSPRLCSTSTSIPT